ncbi:hypothetical protein BDL97_02G174400 [Sphagnum fallax]|nr:hypothetical protein BDL97_02G174400 [Sphagnum fallax]
MVDSVQMRWQILVIQAFSMLELEPDLEALEAEGSRNWNRGRCYDRRIGGQGQAKKDARFLHRNGSMSSGVHEEIGVLFGKADILALGASTSH